MEATVWRSTWEAVEHSGDSYLYLLFGSQNFQFNFQAKDVPCECSTVWQKQICLFRFALMYVSLMINTFECSASDQSNRLTKSCGIKTNVPLMNLWTQNLNSLRLMGWSWTVGWNGRHWVFADNQRVQWWSFNLGINRSLITHKRLWRLDFYVLSDRRWQTLILTGQRGE